MFGGVIKRMNDKGQLAMNIIGLVVFTIIGVAVGLSIFTQFFITDQDRVTSYLQSNVSVTSNNQAIQLDFGRIVDGSDSVVNASCDGNDECNSTMRQGSEYGLLERTGEITFLNRTGFFNVTYDYDPASRLNTQSGRTIASIVPIIFAVALLVMIVRRIIAGTT